MAAGETFEAKRETFTCFLTNRLVPTQVSFYFPLTLFIKDPFCEGKTRDL